MATCTDKQISDDEEGKAVGVTCCPKCNIQLNVQFDRFTNEKYKNWIKASLCLQHTKEGIENFVETTSAEFYNDVKDLISDAVRCTKCKSEDITIRSVKCRTCKTLELKIIESCASGKPTWKNTTLKEMALSHNNVAKLFMPSQCRNYSNPEHGDNTALLSFMAECLKAASKVQNAKVIDVVRSSRNDVMHSGTMLIDEQHLEEIKNRCVTLLMDQSHLKYDKNCQKAIGLIEKIIGHSVHIDFVKEEKKALHDHYKYVEGTLTDLEADIESSECSLDKIEEAKKKLTEIVESQIEMKALFKWIGRDSNKVDELKKMASDIYKKTDEKRYSIENEDIMVKHEEYSKLKTMVSALKHDLDKQVARNNDLEEQLKVKRARDIEGEIHARYEKNKDDYQFEICCNDIHHRISIAVETNLLPKIVSRRSKQDFPCCNRSRVCPCNDYGDLLWKLAELAYHTLFNEESEQRIVFNREVAIMHGLSTAEVDLCLTIGILTFHNSLITNPTTQKDTFSFRNKTIHEYFASTFLSSDAQQSDLDHISSVSSDLDRALGLKNIMLFCGQINPSATRKWSELISKKTDNDPRVQEYRHSCNRYGDVPRADLMERIQNMIIPVTQLNSTLFLSDIFFYEPSWSIERWGYTENQDHSIDDIRHLDLTRLKSIHVERVQVPGDVLETLIQSQYLHKLVLYKSGIRVESIHEIIERSHATLDTLGLYGGRRDKFLYMSRLGKNLREMFPAKLSYLALSRVKLSHKQCHNFSQYIASSPNLRQVKLCYICCETHENREKCVVVDLSSHNHLHTVTLSQLPIADVSINPEPLQKCEFDLPDIFVAQTSMTKCLESARNLRELRFDNITDSEQLVKVLPHLRSLKILDLRGVDFGRLSQICLSAKMEKIKEIVMSDCSITDEGLSSFINSLPGHRVKIKLFGVTVKGGDKSLQHIRNSPNTEIAHDDVRNEDDGWITKLQFDINTGGHCQYLESSL